MTRSKVCLLGFGAALVLIALTAIGVDQQGLYYDELHQGPAAFIYLGKSPQLFTSTFNHVLILNTSYGGAIKSHVYGLYLLLTQHFTVRSWRMTGILFVASALLGFFWIARRRLNPVSGLLFAGLLLTDATVLLTTRFDWGPTALALGIRLILIATWLSMEPDRATTPKMFAVGLLVGVAIFEKLIAVVLLGPLVLMTLSNRKRSAATLLAIAAGGLLGSFPLTYANYSTYHHGLGLISISQTEPSQALHLENVVWYVPEYLKLADGEGAGGHVLGENFHPFWSRAELVLMLGLLTLVATGAIRHRRDDAMRVAAKMLGCYLLVGALMILIPHDTSIHHWIQGTPFQYAAIAIAATAGSSRALRRGVLALIVAILMVRVPTMASMESALISGKSSRAFDREFTQVAEGAAARASEATFIAADWGSATQIYCLGDGKEDLVHETFPAPDPAEAARSVMKNTRKNVVYVVTTGWVPEFANAAKTAEDAVASERDWEEVPPEEEFSSLSIIRVRKFRRRV